MDSACAIAMISLFFLLHLTTKTNNLLLIVF